VKLGFAGKIIATEATLDLCQIMLLDSAHLQEMETQHENRRNLRRGREPVEPLFTVADAARSFPLFSSVSYDQEIEVIPGVSARFLDAGHILGASIIEVVVNNDEGKISLVFSGDLGRYGGLILRDPAAIDGTQILLVESTYGNRLHKSLEDSEEELIDIVSRAHWEGGNVLIPSFAVGRTQELLYIFNKARNERRMPRMPVYLDSPLAIAATEIFQRHPECFDGETLELMRKDPTPFSFPGMKCVRSVEESKALNDAEGAVIIAGSGMCTGGRIKHHLKHQLWKSSTHLVFVGFQAKGTLGRRLVDGVPKVRIFGEDIDVKANVHTLGGFSAHADQAELLRWLGGFKQPPDITFVVHGEPSASSVFSQKVQKVLGWGTYIPTLGESVDIQPRVIGPFHPPRLEPSAPPPLDLQEIEEALEALKESLKRWEQHPPLEIRDKSHKVLYLLKKAQREME
jgi:metallo-beta-lactamase family protein